MDLFLSNVNNTTTTNKQQKNKNKKGNNPPVVVVVNLTGDDSDAVAVTTAEYHADILTLGAFCTTSSIRNNQDHQENDQELYPDNPARADFVLTATGTKNGTERISFWGVSIIINNAAANNKDDTPAFTVQTAILEAFDLGAMEPDTTIFSTPEILRFWRKPKSVHLAEATTATVTAATLLNDSGDDHDHDHEGCLPITTISVSRPICRVEFSPIVRQSTTANDDVNDADLLLVLLDANGGVTYMDCARLERLASHSLTEQEYVTLFETEHPIPLVSTKADRAFFYKLLLQQQQLDHNHDDSSSHDSSSSSSSEQDTQTTTTQTAASCWSSFNE
jgi:hypothetical protein